nr:unnamed protein product [Callosobruchus analis]
MDQKPFNDDSNVTITIRLIMQGKFPYPPPQPNEPTKTLKSLVNIRKESLRFVRATGDYTKVNLDKSDYRDIELGSNSFFNIEFTFDCDVRCAITIYYLCTEDFTASGVTYIPRDASLISETFHYPKGSNQQFCQPTHVFNPAKFTEDDLLYDVDREIIPIAIHCVAVEGPEELRQSHTTIATVEKITDGTYLLKALKQKLFVDGLCYLLQEIYGIENKNNEKAGGDDETEDNGSECVICMCDVRDTLILPCRHLCLCNSCADSLRYQANNCPICRAPFRALLQIRALQKSANSSLAPISAPDGSCDNIPPGYEAVSLIEALNGPCIPRQPPSAMPDLVETPENEHAIQAAQILNRQFQAIMKRLLIHQEIAGNENANAVAMDNTSILHCSSGLPKSNCDTAKRDSEVELSSISDEIHLNRNIWHLTIYLEDVTAYVAGFIVKQLKKEVKCMSCLEILETSDTISKLQIRKKYGLLVNASQYVITVCRFGENVFKEYLKKYGVFRSNLSKIQSIVIHQVLQCLPKNVSFCFADHIYDDELLSNHFIGLTKLILKKFINLRMHHEHAKKKQCDRGSELSSPEYGPSAAPRREEENKETKYPLLEKESRIKHRSRDSVKMVNEKMEKDENADEDSEAEKLSPLLQKNETTGRGTNLALNMVDVVDPIDDADTDQEEHMQAENVVRSQIAIIPPMSLPLQQVPSMRVVPWKALLNDCQGLHYLTQAQGAVRTVMPVALALDTC